MLNVNLDKLPEYVSDFKNKKILVVGLGAVGSLYEDIIVKMGCKYITDMDSLVMFAVAPLNLLKGLVNSIITILVYKRLHRVMK